MKNFGHKLAAAFTTGVIMASSGSASAQDISDVADNITESIGGLPQVFSAVAYLGGTGLSIAGIFKLKQHVDNPTNNPLKDAVGRLGVGGALLALPMVTEAMTSTIGSDGDGASYDDIRSKIDNF